ncbi:hypothetical protein NDU88_004523 [Pleurodeles waltl]|uniref:Uncharacterized protein n=1 Tax=Pleurodeles waltl TaxID=8319 RepID=A0AAV7MTQ0_PLEWA|nr:hypothetical protein NDU88_004523 [Pleurodeles waltl]
MGPLGSTYCEKALVGFQQLAQALGVPVVADKMEGPSMRITFLDIEIESVARVCRLPADKVMALKASIQTCLVGRKVALRQLEVLTGQLNFALRVIPMGRAFSKDVFRVMAGLQAKHHPTRLSFEVREELRTWKCFLDNINGTLL